MGGEVIRAEILFEICLDKRDCPGNARVFRIVLAGSAEIAGNRREADHGSCGIVKRHLRREIPAQRAVAIGDQLQPITHLAS